MLQDVGRVCQSLSGRDIARNLAGNLAGTTALPAGTDRRQNLLIDNRGQIKTTEGRSMTTTTTTKKDREKLLSRSLLVSARVAARLVGVDEETWRRWDAAGRVPRAVRITRGCTRWRLSDLREWIAAGCPKRR